MIKEMKLCLDFQKKTGAISSHLLKLVYRY